MAYQTLLDAYTALNSTHWLYNRNRDRWQFLYHSYVGGDEYRQAGYLTKYQLETANEYNQRLNNTPLDNQCQSVIQTYVSFLFREEPEREFGTWEGMEQVESFLKDCDFEGRNLDAFMKQAAIWSSVFGHCWIIMTKPNLGAVTQQQEIDMGIRPYVSLLTPLSVSDWRWVRMPNGSYQLGYLKYIEEIADKIQIIKEWTPQEILTWHVNEQERTAELKTTEPNLLGSIPAVMVYNLRSVVKDIGISDLNDVADLQRQIYNLLSEQEQQIRIDGHPTLVVPPTAQVGSGAGAVIQLQDGSDPGLNPYYLESGSASVSNIHSSIDKLVEAIDRISFTGGIRGKETRTMSGVAMEVEFNLLAAKLSEKADQLELAEEQMWRLFGQYLNLTWDGEIEYPKTFSVHDNDREFNQLQMAKSAATDPRVLAAIDHEILQLLGEESDLIMPEYVATQAANLPARPLFEAHTMYNPKTGDEVIARTEAEHIAYAEQGYIHKEEN